MKSSAFKMPVHIAEVETVVGQATASVLDALFGYCLCPVSSLANHDEFLLSSGPPGLLLCFCGSGVPHGA